MTMTGGIPPIRYAKAAGDVNIAYRVVGDGPVDVVWVPGLFSNLEIEWENGDLYRRLASFSRLITFDKRGMGLSDRDVRCADAGRAHGRCPRGDGHGGVGAGRPHRRVRGRPDEPAVRRDLSRTHGGPRPLRDDGPLPPDVDYPHGIEDSLARLREIFDDGWGTGGSMELIAPSVQDDPRARVLFGRMERAAGSPGTMRMFVDSLGDIDVRGGAPDHLGPDARHPRDR